MMMYVVARVSGKTYLVKVDAETMGGAESQVLSKAVCGIDEYGIEAAQAFDAKSMKTDTFIWMALEAEPITMKDFDILVEKRNEEVLARKAAYEKLWEREKELRDLTDRVEQAKREIEEARKYLESK